MSDHPDGDAYDAAIRFYGEALRGDPTRLAKAAQLIRQACQLAGCGDIVTREGTTLTPLDIDWVISEAERTYDDG